jgi:hypothetical protein
VVYAPGLDSRKEATEEGASGETAPLLTSTGGGGGDMAGVRSLRESSDGLYGLDSRQEKHGLQIK